MALSKHAQGEAMYLVDKGISQKIDFRLVTEGAMVRVVKASGVNILKASMRENGYIQVSTKSKPLDFKCYNLYCVQSLPVTLREIDEKDPRFIEFRYECVDGMHKIRTVCALVESAEWDETKAFVSIPARNTLRTTAH